MIIILDDTRDDRQSQNSSFSFCVCVGEVFEVVPYLRLLSLCSASSHAKAATPAGPGHISGRYGSLANYILLA